MIARGIRNNNPLNLVKGNKWQGERANQTDPVFEEFETMLYGIRAAMIVLKNYMIGRKGSTARYNTVRKIITRWAPPIENNTARYIDKVCADTGLHPDEVFEFREKSRVVAVLRSMAHMECGTWLDVELFKAAYDLVR